MTSVRAAASLVTRRFSALSAPSTPKTEWPIVPIPAARAAGKTLSGKPGAGNASWIAENTVARAIAASATAASPATASARALPLARISSSACWISSRAISAGFGIVQRIEIDMVGAEPPQTFLERTAQ